MDAKEIKVSKIEIEVVEVDGKVYVNALQLLKMIGEAFGIYSDVPPPPPPTK